MDTETFTDDDRHFMRRALELAARGLESTHPNPRVGCVLVRDGQVVGEGWHRAAGELHAEALALAAAGEAARGATAYVTLEPCAHHGRTPPCVDALLAAGIAQVCYASGDPDPRVDGAGAARLRAAGVPVRGGLLAAAGDELNAGFLSRLRRGRPFVRAKIAASLDGRTALASGASQWITGTAARADVQRWRARSDAILTGIGTVLADDPQLTVRLPADDGIPRRQPLRVVLDSRLRLPRSARVLGAPGRALIFSRREAVGAELATAAQDAMRRDGIALEWLESAEGGLDLSAALTQLAREHQINEVLVEAGATLTGALLRARLVDELLIYQAPLLLGGDARALAQLPALAALQDAPRFEFTELAMVGGDLRMRLRPA
jgi:diaminohydroxyphosphoribosylaminopyrimidine deaminase/5-amino-6-(5-phosphoribosylamino)uracil reductase